MSSEGLSEVDRLVIVSRLDAFRLRFMFWMIFAFFWVGVFVFSFVIASLRETWPVFWTVGVMGFVLSVISLGFMVRVKTMRLRYLDSVGLGG